MPVPKMLQLKLSMLVLRMLWVSNYDTEECQYQKILVLEIPILNMPALENAYTREEQYWKTIVLSATITK